VAGDPGSTEREITAAQRTFARDVVAPLVTFMRAEWRGELTQFMRGSEEQKRIATEWQFYNENSPKAYKGRLAALRDEGMIKKTADAETALRAAIATKPEVAKQVGDAYDAIARALAKFKPLYHRYYVLERWNKGDLMTAATYLVRGADERALPDGKRL